MEIVSEIRNMKDASPYLAASSNEARCEALKLVSSLLVEAKEEIFEENEKDLKAAKENGIPDAVYHRLKFDEGKLKACIDGIETLIEMEDPVGKVTLCRQLDQDLLLKRVAVPIGVIGVIFEARPDALIQISSLCIRSGNCAVLKGGKETTYTNRILFSLIRKAVQRLGLPKACLLQAEQHEEIDALLKLDHLVDLIIPRGSNAFVRHIMDNTKIPVMGHADGICHIYVDAEADLLRSLDVIVDAKLQYTAACNAVETILVDKAVADTFLPMLYERLSSEGVEAVEGKADDDFIEYLDRRVSVKTVDSMEEAIGHINRLGSHHTDCIMTKNDKKWEVFSRLVDSAGVYRNCSTRFADGFRYGFGAEVGIGTGKIHARGPVGIEGLMTYKYLLEGNGQIVADYASGKKTFRFRDL